MLPIELSKMQRIALDARVGKKRRAERTRAQCHQHAPRAAQRMRFNYRVRKDPWPLPAIEAHFPYDALHARAHTEDGAFPALDRSDMLRQHVQAKIVATLLNAQRERAPIQQPAPQPWIGTDGERLP